MTKFCAVLMYSLRRFASDAKGTTAIEYALIGAGIAAVIITAVSMVGTNLQPYWDKVGAAFN